MSGIDTINVCFTLAFQARHGAAGGGGDLQHAAAVDALAHARLRPQDGRRSARNSHDTPARQAHERADKMYRAIFDMKFLPPGRGVLLAAVAAAEAGRAVGDGLAADGGPGAAALRRPQ